MLYLFIYLAGIIDTFRNFLVLGIPVFIVLGMVFIATKTDEYMDEGLKEIISKFFKGLVVTLCVVSFLYIYSFRQKL